MKKTITVILARARSQREGFSRKLGVAEAFLMVAFVFGLVFSLKTPLLWGADETTHFARAYQISQGGITSEKLAYPWGGYSFGGQIPSSAHDLILYVNEDIGTDNEITKYGTKRIDNLAGYSRLANESIQGETETYYFPNMAAYSPVAYITTAPALFIAKLLSFSVGNAVLLARIGNLFLYILLVYLALRSLKGMNASWLIFAVALIPAALFNASMISADGVANAFAILFSALVIKGWLYKKKLNKAETIVLALTAIGLPLVKLPYIFLTLALLAIPAKNIAFKKGNYIKAGVVGAALLVFSAWAYVTPEVANSIKMIGTGDRWQYISVDNQKDFILSHPFSFVETFFRTLILRDNNLVDGFFGQFSFIFITVPAAAIITSLFSIFISMQLIEKKLDQNIKRYLYVAALLLISVGGVFGTLYLTFTNVGWPTIEGVQGRYFLPFAPLAFMLIAVLLPRFSDRAKLKDIKMAKYWITGCITFGLLATTVKFFYVLLG